MKTQGNKKGHDILEKDSYTINREKEIEEKKEALKEIEEIIEERERLIRNIFSFKEKVKEKEVIIKKTIKEIVENRTIKGKKKILRKFKKILRILESIEKKFTKRRLYPLKDFTFHERRLLEHLIGNLKKEYFYKTNFFYIEKFMFLIEKIEDRIIKEVLEHNNRGEYTDIIKSLKKTVVFIEKFIEKNLILKEEIFIK